MSTLKAFQLDFLSMKNTITNKELIAGGHGCGTASEDVKLTGKIINESIHYVNDTSGDWNDEGCCGEE